MVDAGFFVWPGRASLQATVALIMLHETPSGGILTSDRVGWVQASKISIHPGKTEGATFILPSRVFGWNGSIRFSANIEHQYKASGVLSDWQANVARLCAGNSRLVLAISAAFAGALLRPVGAESGGIHFVGPSSLGKTTALLVGGSVCGGRSGGPNGFMNVWRATDNGLELLANLHNDSLLVLDELGQLSPLKASEAAYLLSNGAGKTRMRSDTSQRKALEWRLIFLSSGELTLYAHAAKAGVHTSAGSEVRMLNLPAEAGCGLGMFENLHGLADGKIFSETLKENAQTYFGTALESYLEKLVADQQGAIDFVNRFKGEFFQENKIDSASGEVGRAMERFALLGAAGELATEYGITGWQQGEASTAARICFASWLKTRGTIGAIDVDRAIDQIRNIIERNPAKFGRLGGNDNYQEIKPQGDRFGFYRQQDGHTEYLILPGVFKQEFCKGFDHRATAAELHRRGFLRCGKDRLQIQVALPSGLGQRAYCIADTIFDNPESGSI
jgi:uncharacterized protein (DUF927 family)